MKTKRLFFILVLITAVSFTFAQTTVKPVLIFDENPKTHNAGIASDGKYLYTVNGGVSSKGRIGKFSLTGHYIDSYTVNLDMRSIFYNSRNKSFYVNCYDRSIYKITNIITGAYELVKSDLYQNEQASLALSPNGKLLYCFDKGVMKIYKFPSFKLYKTLTGFDYGSGHTGGEAAVAVSGKHIYTWNGNEKMIFQYSSKGVKKQTFYISNGDYGFSLSYANKLVFVAIDGDYSTGTWYGYDLDNK